ncbi:MAG: hypothetical protein ACHQF2_00165 [Flavobacteriales bacterium]
MQHFKKQKKIGLPPGFISLVLLPLLLILFLNHHRVFKKEYCISMTFPIEEAPMEADRLDGMILRFTAFGFLNERKWEHNLVMTGNHNNDKILIKQFRKRLRDICQRKDTLQGAGIIYHKNTSFSEFVQLVNICLEDSVGCYMGSSIGFYAFYYEKPKPRKTNHEISVMGGDVVPDYEWERQREEYERQEYEAKLANFRNEQWPLLFCFFPLVLMGFINLRNLKKTHFR